MDEVNIPDESVAQFLNDLQTIKAEQSNVSVPRDDIATIDNLEQFVLKNSSEIINSSINMLKNMESVVQAVQGAEEMSAYSELVNASTNAIDTLNKILLQKKKNDALIEIKKMDVENKKELQSNDHAVKVMASREEILKMMLSAKMNQQDEINVTHSA
jgi:hypothetical protein